MGKRLPPPINRALIEKIAAASKASKLNSGKVVAVGPGSHDGEERLSAVSWNEGGEKKSSQTSSQQQRTKPAVRSSVNYVVVQYLLSAKNKMQFDPVLVLKHFKAPVAEPSTIAPLL